MKLDPEKLGACDYDVAIKRAIKEADLANSEEDIKKDIASNHFMIGFD